MKVALNEVAEKESDLYSGTQMLHLCKQRGKGLCKIYRKWLWAGKCQLLIWPHKAVLLALQSSQGMLLKTKEKSIPFSPLPVLSLQSEATWAHPPLGRRERRVLVCISFNQIAVCLEPPPQILRKKQPLKLKVGKASHLQGGGDSRIFSSEGNDGKEMILFCMSCSEFDTNTCQMRDSPARQVYERTSTTKCLWLRRTESLTGGDQINYKCGQR